VVKRFALIGAAGYIAPRHMKAIKDVGGNLVAMLDPSDSVGIIDGFFPQSEFFVEFERFDRHIEKLRRRGDGVNYVGICSPNYLHDAHIRFALRSNADAICEKPLVLNPWNLDALKEIEVESGRRIYNILQLRLHPALQALKKRIQAEPSGRVHDVDLTYLTARGNWYFISWKGDIAKSGGIATNIGIRFFDMLIWVFGSLRASTVHLHRPDVAAGTLELERARIRWFLSVNADFLPAEVRERGQRTYRSICVDGEEIEFSEGFGDLHTKSYAAILDGEGFGVEHARPSIESVFEIRNAPVSPLTGDYHPFCTLVPEHPSPVYLRPGTALRYAR
jgi:UDP-N-acetyl-2-amino-2-deoxyglucuronate dehydrogenase